jgi:hypothetical protein
MNFPNFEALLQTYPTCRIKEYQRAYSLKAEDSFDHEESSLKVDITG